MVILIMLEETGAGDGLKIHYFDNEIFEGESSEVHVRNLDFMWNGQPPVRGVNG